MNPRVDAIPGSLIREIAAKKRPTSIDLGLGEPSLPPNRAHFEAAMRAVDRRGVKYTVNAGDPELRAAIAAYYRYPQMDRAENVCVTTGSQEAMFATLLTLLDPARDELLVVEPAFPSYAKMAALNGAGCRSIAMPEGDGFAFDPERIVAAVTPATRAIVICSPNNPTARVLTRDEAEGLASGLMALGESRPWVIHDEIYREQTFCPEPAELARCYPQTVVTNSLSKSNALTGLRLGWLIGPQAFVASAVKAHAWLTSCADTFAQYVAMAVFASELGVREHAGWYVEHRARLLQALRESGLPYIPPDGSFYVCVKAPAGVASLDAANELIDRFDVVTIPGIAFGESLEGWLRLSWVAPADQVAEGISRIARYCGVPASAAGTT